MHHEDNESCEYDALELADLKQIEGSSKPSKKSLLKNWPLMSSIIVYCVFSLHDMAYTEVNYFLFFVFINFYFPW